MLNYLILLFISLKFLYAFHQRKVMLSSTFLIHQCVKNTIGCDNRNITESNEINIKTFTIFLKKNVILKKLESNQYSIHEKIELLSNDQLTNNNTIKPLNVLNGGLFKQWDFDFEL